MEGISSTPVEDSVKFLRLRDQYKSKLLDDSRLTKAADLAAQQHILFESKAPDTWKEPRLKAVGRQLRQWTKKVRQPGGTRAIGSGEDFEDASDEEDNLAVGPVHQLISKIAKISQKGIKRPATPKNPDIKQSPITPDIKKSPPSSKKAKFSFQTGFKGKRLLPKTPLKKSSVKKTTTLFKTPEKSSEELPTELSLSDTVGESPWNRGAESARDTNRKIKEGAKQVKKGILKKLEPAPGWKPFGTPVKRKLDGKDWK